MTNCICEQPDYEGQAKSNGGWDKGCPVHGDPEPEGDFVGIGRNGSVSPKAADTSPNCICATNCHFDCEDKLCKCPHHLTAAEAPGGQRAESCSCGSHDLAPLYHHPKCALAPAAPSERARFVEWYAKWPNGRPTSDGLTVSEIIEAAEAYAEYVSGASPSLSEERERFEQNVLSDPEFMECDRRFSVGRNEDGNYLLDFVQRRWEGWQARAGLSSQEGK